MWAAAAAEDDMEPDMSVKIMSCIWMHSGSTCVDVGVSNLSLFEALQACIAEQTLHPSSAFPHFEPGKHPMPLSSMSLGPAKLATIPFRIAAIYRPLKSVHLPLVRTCKVGILSVDPQLQLLDTFGWFEV